MDITGREESIVTKQKESSPKQPKNGGVTTKRKTLFNHVAAIYEDQSIGYYDNLSVEDRKSFGIFMIKRFM